MIAGTVEALIAGKSGYKLLGKQLFGEGLSKPAQDQSGGLLLKTIKTACKILFYHLTI
jgi:hypothetical protein